MKNRVLTFITLALMPAVMQAQEAKQIAFSVQTGHYYDLQYTSFDDLLNGASGEDMRGLNGMDTKFDVGMGLRAHYYYSPLVSFELGYDRATVTGANSVEWHSSQNSAYSVGAKFSMKKSTLTETLNTVPFARISMGILNYEAQRSFVSDGIEFSNTVGATSFTTLGFGVQHHITNAFSVNLQSSLRVVNTDAWDGYDYSSGRDHLMMTTIGVEYALGKGSHMNRLPTSRDPRVNSVLDEINLIKQNEESTLKMLDIQAKENAELKEKYALLEKGMEELATKQAEFSKTSTSETIAPYVIYYDFNSSKVQTVFELELQKRVFELADQNAVFTIQAFSDEKGTKLANSLIRARRIAKIKALLKSWGIQDDNIVIKEWDGSHSGNDRLDRRVELTVKVLE
jgi:outer membrane protein OmpA-like peptidoglycan-associated protein